MKELDELEETIKAYYFNPNIFCMSCKKEVRATDCVIFGSGIVTCPACHQDICNGEV